MDSRERDSSLIHAKSAALVRMLLLAVAALIAPGSHAIAQTVAAPKRLGILAGTTCPTPDGPSIWKPLLRNLADHGWIEGRTLIVDCIAAGNRLEQAPALALELVGRRPDVLLGASTPTVMALKQATATIPIVTAASDPLRSGIVSNLAHPDTNVTGLAPMSFDLVAKRIELLKDILPRFSRLAILYRKGAYPVDHEQMQKDATAAARTLGFAWEAFYPAAPEDVESIFARLASEGFDAVYVWSTPFTYLNRTHIAKIAIQYRVPTISESSDYAREGALLTYGLDVSRLIEASTEYIDKLLRGGSSADLPLRQPTKFDLVINLKTAKAIGVEVPQSVLFRADEVIE